jgi:glc operon protein GlcG
MSEKLTLEEARAIIARAVEKSTEVDWISTYAVVDEGGNVMSISRVDGAPAAAAGLSRSKAYFAAVSCRTTLPFSVRMDAHPVRFAGYQSILPRPLFPGPGAMPIRKDGKVVGGFSSSVSSHKGGMQIEIDGKRLSREDVVTAYALQIPYEEQHADVA